MKKIYIILATRYNDSPLLMYATDDYSDLKIKESYMDGLNDKYGCGNHAIYVEEININDMSEINDFKERYSWSHES